jgi:hypothetical protein
MMLPALIWDPDRFVTPDPEIVRLPVPRFSELVPETETPPPIVSPEPTFTWLPLNETCPGPVIVIGLLPEE